MTVWVLVTPSETIVGPVIVTSVVKEVVHARVFKGLVVGAQL